MVLKYSPPLLVLALGAALSRQSGFSSPDFVEPYGSGAYENVDVWYVGQTKEVAYDITDVSGLDKYTIALWQQALSGGAATLGPVVDSTRPPDVRDSFSWRVQLYDFDLEQSNVFFFWLFNGTADNQGNFDFGQVSSAYFNISNEDPPVSTSTSSPTTSSPTTSSTSTATNTVSATASKTATAQDNSATTTGAVSTSTSTSEHGSGGGSGISTGAGVGIGVGVGVAGVSAIICALIIVRSKRLKKQTHIDNPESRPGADMHELPGPGGGFVGDREKQGPELPLSQSVPEQEYLYHRQPEQEEPVEIYTEQQRSPVELNAGRRGDEQWPAITYNISG